MLNRFPPLFAWALALSFSHVSRAEIQNSVVENFLRPPRVYSLQISPDGKYAAGPASIGETHDRGVVVIDLDTMEIKKSFSWPSCAIYGVTWTTNEDLVIEVVKWGMWADGVYCINVNDREADALLKNDVSCTILDPVTEEPWSWIRIFGGYRMKPCIAKLDTTGNAKAASASQKVLSGNTAVQDTSSNRLISDKIFDPAGEVHNWFLDQDHQPRIVQRFLDEKLEYMHRTHEDEEWKQIPLDPEDWSIELFGKDKDTIYISGYNDQETKGLYPYSIKSAEIGELIFRDPFYDFSDSASYILYNGDLIGFRYMKDKPAIVWIMPDMLEIQKMVDQTLPDRTNIFIGSSDDFTRHLIASYSDKIAPEYSLLNLKDRSFKTIVKSAPWLSSEQLSKTTPFRFKTDDGLKLEGYLTRPSSGKAPHPTVCLVHGGPWARDTGGYYDEVQLLASQGYAVLQVNYRGSTGYGKRVSDDGAWDFVNMNADISKAVRTAIKFKIADPDRIAIMGASFGGYAALFGVAFEPDLYQCAITNMGVFDWEELMKSRKRQGHKYSYFKMKKELGDPKLAETKFDSISPIKHVDKIKVPVLIIHGKDDQNVSIRQSKELASALKSNQVPHKTLLIKGEGHHVFGMENRVMVFKEILRFLDENLK